MKLLKPLVFFLCINFGSLALGSYLMGNGPSSDWYINLNRAPWTPPGWVFGAAWTVIMICFSIYLAYLFNKTNTLNLKLIFVLQVFLNSIWNFLFFNQHLVLLGLIAISSLTLVLFYFFFKYKKIVNHLSYLLLPYMVWLLIATSLNAYILLNN